MTTRILVLILTSVAAGTGCGPVWRFEVTSPDLPLEQGNRVIFRMVSPSGAEAGTLRLTCEGDVCKSPWDGGGELDPDAEVLVWLDVDADDWEEWTAAQSAPVNYEALAPDAVDPRAQAVWEPGLGVHTIAVELRLPD